MSESRLAELARLNALFNNEQAERVVPALFPVREMLPVINNRLIMWNKNGVNSSSGAQTFDVNTQFTTEGEEWNPGIPSTWIKEHAHYIDCIGMKCTTTMSTITDPPNIALNWQTPGGSNVPIVSTFGAYASAPAYSIVAGHYIVLPVNRFIESGIPLQMYYIGSAAAGQWSLFIVGYDLSLAQ